MGHYQEAIDTLGEVCFVTPQVVPIAGRYIAACRLAGDDNRLAAAKELGLKWCRELYGPDSAEARQMLQMH